MPGPPSAAPFEVEAKVALADPGAVRATLQRLGAAGTPPAIEEDLFFSHPGRDLAASDEALRLRRRVDGWELTYKGPRQPGPYKARVERTVRLVDDPAALLGSLGFAPAVRLRKQRERFRLGAVEVTLDHVEGVGWFAEVEAMGPDAVAAEAAVESGLRRLGLSDRPRVTGSYVELALAAGAGAAERA